MIRRLVPVSALAVPSLTPLHAHMSDCRYYLKEYLSYIREHVAIKGEPMVHVEEYEP